MTTRPQLNFPSEKISTATFTNTSLVGLSEGELIILSEGKYNQNWIRVAVHHRQTRQRQIFVRIKFWWQLHRVIKKKKKVEWIKGPLTCTLVNILNIWLFYHRCSFNRKIFAHFQRNNISPLIKSSSQSLSRALVDAVNKINRRSIEILVRWIQRGIPFFSSLQNASSPFSHAILPICHIIHTSLVSSFSLTTEIKMKCRSDLLLELHIAVQLVSNLL